MMLQPLYTILICDNIDSVPPKTVILSYDKRWCRVQPWYICSVITAHGVPSPVILSYDKR